MNYRLGSPQGSLCSVSLPQHTAAHCIETGFDTGAIACVATNLCNLCAELWLNGSVESGISHRRRIIAFLLLFAVLSLNGFAQNAPATGAAIPFEAISIKESTGLRIPVQWQGTRFLAGAIPLQTLLIVAYQVPFYQLSDLPEWVRTVRWEINAVASRAPAPTEEARFLRALLEERFQIVARTEVQERPMYALIIARPDRQLGPGLRPTTVDCGEVLSGRAAGTIPPNAGASCRIAVQADSYARDGISLGLVADRISTLLGRPVEDRTGLTGFYDVELHHRPMNATAPVDTDQPDLITAMQEQLGLKIESTRGSVQVTVFDRIERPTAN